MTRPLAVPAEPRASTLLEVRNRIAMAGWIFTAIWLGMLGLFTWVMARDGPHPSQPAELQHGALALFWLFGIGGGAQLFSQPCTRFAVAADGTARLTRWTPFGRTTERFARGDITAIALRQDRDSDGDPYFRTVLVGSDGTDRVIREGRDPDEQQALAERLRQAIGVG